MWRNGARPSYFSPHKILLPGGFSGHSKGTRILKVLVSHIFAKAGEQDRTVPWSILGQRVPAGSLPTAVLFLLINWAQLRAGIGFHGGGYCCVCVVVSFWFLNRLSSPGVFLFTLLMSPMRSGFPLPLRFFLSKDDLMV